MITNNIAKKLVILIGLGLGIFIFGIISVDERENAVVTNLANNKSQTLAPGLHFAWPLIDKVHYIFMNKRDGLFSIDLSFPDNANVEVGTLVEWQVVNPEIYLSVFKNDTFNKGLTTNVRQLLETRAKTTNLSTFNQLSNLISQPLMINNLGIQINRISSNELKLVVSSAPVVKPSDIDKMPVKKPMVETSSASQTSLESAYYQAQMIKTQTEIEQAKMYQSLEQKDPRFYAYFRKLQIYKMSAKTKQDMPALEDLYK